MDGRAATIAALAVALIGIVAFLLLEGMASGLALLAAGVLLVLIGVFGWQAPRTAVVTAGGGALAVDLAEAGPSDVLADAPMHGEPLADRGSADTARMGDEPTVAFAPVPDVADHVHDQPIRNHSDLAAHVRDRHDGVSTTGSTIQLRLLHEREHGATA